MNDFDALLAYVSRQARQAGVPISEHVSPHVQVNTRARRRFGLCRKSGSGFCIELSDRLLQAPERSVCQTLAHELIHTCPGCFDHGEGFRRYARRMNEAYGYQISRTSSPEEMGVTDAPQDAKYILQCRQCGTLIYRMRRTGVVTNPERCRCGKCGGRLMLVSGELPQGAPAAPPKYLLQCSGCGKTIPRMKMSRVVRYPSQYRCGSCGGTLKRIR